MLTEDRIRLGRRREIFYDEIHSIEHRKGATIIECNDGRRHKIRPRNGQDLGATLSAIVSDYPKRLDQTATVEGLQESLADLAAQPGFVATGFVEYLLRIATRLGASDIHIAPTLDQVEVRLRIEGALICAGRLTNARGQRVSARLKVMAGLMSHRSDITQEGRVEVDSNQEFRLSCVPAIGGERIVIRAFDRIKSQISSAELGFAEPELIRLRCALRAAQGLVIISGPSAGGKTTTAYSLLREIAAQRSGTTSTVTIDDPVECRLSGIDQLEAGGSHAVDLLRSVLRQDVDVLMVGEIRTPETAQAAAEASTTGHLVIATMHAGTACEAVVRLHELGVEHHVLSTMLLAVSCQRLVRKSKGGREAIGEVMLVDDTLREALTTPMPAKSLERIAMATGMTPLREVASQKLQRGVISEQELERVLG